MAGSKVVCLNEAATQASSRVQDFATVWSIPYLPDFPHSSVSSEDDGSKEISGDLSPVD